MSAAAAARATATTPAEPVPAGADAAVVARLLAVDPTGLGGVVLRSAAGAVRDAWMAAFGGMLPSGSPMRRIPPGIGDDALLGGLDLAATLSRGSAVVTDGLLARCNRGLAVVPMAERMSVGLAARFAGALDTGKVVLARDGVHRTVQARMGLVLLDEGVSDEEAVPPALADRVAFRLVLPPRLGDLEGLSDVVDGADKVMDARKRLRGIIVPDEILDALCAGAAALGVGSLRAPLLAVRVARAAAALEGSLQADAGHAALAARLVLAHRATRIPDAPEQPPPPEAPEPEQDRAERDQPEEQDAQSMPPIDDLVLAAAAAAIPPGLLAQLEAKRRRGAASDGRSGAVARSPQHGRCVGVRAGETGNGAKVAILATLRQAAPWQRLRGAARLTTGRGRILVSREDIRLEVREKRTQTTTIFVVDASGSAALHRLAECKGAVQLLLADCYVRRDQVALVTFRGAGAEVILPPTRSLARARRLLAGMPGGGGTPLAAGIDTARALAESLRQRGQSPLLVIMTDGRGNIARDGTPGRAKAGEDSLAAARAVRASGLRALIIDSSPLPHPAARALATAMDAPYCPLPHAQAGAVSRAVRAVAEVP